jgi:FtsH-binding integral membrane protein
MSSSSTRLPTPEGPGQLRDTEGGELHVPHATGARWRRGRSHRAFGCIFGLNIAAAKGREQLAIGLLFGLGLLLGLAVAPVIADYAKADPSALWQAAGATAAFVAASGAYGYATRRDLSAWARTLFWALLGLIAFGIVAIFVSIHNGHIIYAVAGLGIFGAFTIFDFNRLRRASSDSAIAIAASIFLDIFNVFLLLLELFGGSRE